MLARPHGTIGDLADPHRWEFKHHSLAIQQTLQRRTPTACKNVSLSTSASGDRAWERLSLLGLLGTEPVLRLGVKHGHQPCN